MKPRKNCSEEKCNNCGYKYHSVKEIWKEIKEKSSKNQMFVYGFIMGLLSLGFIISFIWY